MSFPTNRPINDPTTAQGVPLTSGQAAAQNEAPSQNSVDSSRALPGTTSAAVIPSPLYDLPEGLLGRIFAFDMPQAFRVWQLVSPRFREEVTILLHSGQVEMTGEARNRSSSLCRSITAAGDINSPQVFYQVFTRRVFTYEKRWAAVGPVTAPGSPSRESVVPYFQAVQTREERYLTVVWQTLGQIIEMSANPPEGISGPRLQLPAPDAPEEISTWMEDPQNWIHCRGITMGSLPLTDRRHHALNEELTVLRNRAEAGLNGLPLPAQAAATPAVNISDWDATRWWDRRFQLIDNMSPEGSRGLSGHSLSRRVLGEIRTRRRGQDEPLFDDIPAPFQGRALPGHNQLVSLPEGLFQGFTGLLHLNLDNNRLHVLPEQIGVLVALQELDLNADNPAPNDAQDAELEQPLPNPADAQAGPNVVADNNGNQQAQPPIAPPNGQPPVVAQNNNNGLLSRLDAQFSQFATNTGNSLRGFFLPGRGR